MILKTAFPELKNYGSKAVSSYALGQMQWRIKMYLALKGGEAEFEIQSPTIAADLVSDVPSGTSGADSKKIQTHALQETGRSKYAREALIRTSTEGVVVPALDVLDAGETAPEAGWRLFWNGSQWRVTEVTSFRPDGVTALYFALALETA